MPARAERRAPRANRSRWTPRQLLWWLWPTMPSSWAEVPARLRPGAVQIARLTIAAVVAYVVADALFPGIVDLTAPLTALLVVQASTVGTLLMGVVRVGAVLTGVLVAIAVTSAVGLSWWSLAIVISASLVVAMVLRLGDQTLEAPISAMLILAVATPGGAAEVRVANTLIGTLVGIAFSVIVPVAIPNARASEAVRRVIRSQAGLMNEIAMTLGDRPPHPDELRAWTDWSDDIVGEVRAATALIDEVRKSRRLNPRALATAAVDPGLRGAIERLGRVLAAQRAMVVAIGKQATAGTDAPPTEEERELRAALAVVLDDLAEGLRAYGDLVDAEYGRGLRDRADAMLSRMLEIVGEARAVLTELRLLAVDPRERLDLSMLHGSVLTALEHMVEQLDLEHSERAADPWLRRVPVLGERLPATAWRRGRDR
ncbi:MAG: hypothetical protein JWP66_1355 [Naasia sp.]|nr:hypothetical protein [Naasia sp.]